MTDLEQRSIALRDKLAVLRVAAGLSGRQLATKAGWQPSKISRIENHQQRVTDADIDTWCRLTGASRATTQQIRMELRTIRADAARWSQQLETGHRALQEDMAAAEQHATHIRGFELALVPGLLQTAEYAHTVFAALADLRRSPADTNEAVRSRMQRQQVLYDSTKTIELLTSEMALRHPIGNRHIMAAQLDRLTALDGLPALRLGILPVNAAVPVPPLHGFWILDQEQVLLETGHREVTTEDAEDIALYERMAEALWSAAATGEEARRVVRCIRDELLNPSPS